MRSEYAIIIFFFWRKVNPQHLRNPSGEDFSRIVIMRGLTKRNSLFAGSPF